MSRPHEILVLNAGLFPDQRTLITALDSNVLNQVELVEIQPQKMDQSAWRYVLVRIMDADVTIVL